MESGLLKAATKSKPEDSSSDISDPEEDFDKKMDNKLAKRKAEGASLSLAKPGDRGLEAAFSQPVDQDELHGERMQAFIDNHTEKKTPDEEQGELMRAFLENNGIKTDETSGKTDSRGEDALEVLRQAQVEDLSSVSVDLAQDEHLKKVLASRTGGQIEMTDKEWEDLRKQARQKDKPDAAPSTEMTPEEIQAFHDEETGGGMENVAPLGSVEMAAAMQNMEQGKALKEQQELQLDAIRAKMDQAREQMMDAKKSQMDAKGGLNKFDRLKAFFRMKGNDGTARKEYFDRENQYKLADQKFRRAYEEYCKTLYDQKRQEMDGSGMDKNSLQYQQAIYEFVSGDKVIDVRGADGQAVKKGIIEYFQDTQLEVDNMRLERMDSRDKSIALKLMDKYRSMPKSKRLLLGAAVAAGIGVGGSMAGGAAASYALGYGVWRGAKSLGRAAFGAGLSSWLNERLKTRDEKENQAKEVKLYQELSKGFKEGKLEMADMIIKLAQDKKRQDYKRLVAVGAAAGMSSAAFTLYDLHYLSPQPGGGTSSLGRPGIKAAYAAETGGKAPMPGVSEPSIEMPKATKIEPTVRTPYDTGVNEIKTPYDTGAGKIETPNGTVTNKVETPADTVPKDMKGSPVPERPAGKGQYHMKDGVKYYQTSEGKTFRVKTPEYPHTKFEQQTVAKPERIVVDVSQSAEKPPLFQGKLAKGDTVWDKLENHYNGNQRDVANKLVEFKKATAYDLTHNHGMNPVQAKKYIEWKFTHMDVGDTVQIDANGRLNISRFTHPDEIEQYRTGRVKSAAVPEEGPKRPRRPRASAEDHQRGPKRPRPPVEDRPTKPKLRSNDALMEEYGKRGGKAGVDDYDRRIERARQDEQFGKEEGAKHKAEAEHFKNQKNVIDDRVFIKNIERIRGMKSGDFKIRVQDLVTEKAFNVPEAKVNEYWNDMNQTIGRPFKGDSYDDFIRHRKMAKYLAGYIKQHPKVLSEGALNMNVDQFLDMVAAGRDR